MRFLQRSTYLITFCSMKLLIKSIACLQIKLMVSGVHPAFLFPVDDQNDAPGQPPGRWHFANKAMSRSAEAQSHGSSTCRQNQVGFGHGVRSWSPRTSLLWRNQWRPWCAGNNSASFNLPGSPLGCISMSCYFDKQHACQELAR